MDVKEHYDAHLSAIYAWMTGDFEKNVESFRAFLETHRISKGGGRLAIDLGAGNGVQSVALARHGYDVKAIDFSDKMLSGLQQKKENNVECIHADLKDFQKYCTKAPELIICWGDTLTHLSTTREVEDLLGRAAHSIKTGGYLLLSFRDYTHELKDDARFIPVKSDDKRILTCMLEYFPMYVKVSDLYQEYASGKWNMKVSSYLKLRLEPSEVIEILEENDFEVVSSETDKGLLCIVAIKK